MEMKEKKTQRQAERATQRRRRYSRALHTLMRNIFLSARPQFVIQFLSPLVSAREIMLSYEPALFFLLLLLLYWKHRNQFGSSQLYIYRLRKQIVQKWQLVWCKSHLSGPMQIENIHRQKKRHVVGKYTRLLLRFRG